jgi:hypothetical protein
MKPCNGEEVVAKITAAKEKKANHENKIIDASTLEIARWRGY